MSEKNLKMRTAVFGGFQRQDVVDYIERNTQEHNTQINALRAELKQAREQLTVLEGEKARADGLQERCDILSRRVDDLTPLAESVPGLMDQVEQYRPDALAYRQLKDTLADIELEARTRAAQVLAQAEEEAEAKRTMAQALLDQVTEEYNRMGASANSAIDNVISTLTELRDSFTSMSQLQEELRS